MLHSDDSNTRSASTSGKRQALVSATMNNRHGGRFLAVFLLKVLIVIFCISVSAQAAGDQSALMEKMEALSKKMQACGGNASCLQGLMKEMEKLTKEYQKTQMSNGQGGVPSLQKLRDTEKEVAEALQASKEDPCYPVYFDKELVKRIEGFDMPWVKCVPLRISLIWNIDESDKLLHGSRRENRARYTLEESYPGYLRIDYDPEKRDKINHLEIHGPSPQKLNFVSAALTRVAATFYVYTGPDTLEGIVSTNDPNDFAIHKGTNLPDAIISISNDVASRSRSIGIGSSNIIPSEKLVKYPVAGILETLEGGTLYASGEGFSLEEVQRGMREGRLSKEFSIHEINKYPAISEVFRREGTVTVSIEFQEAPKPGVLAVKPGDGLNSAGPDDKGKFTPQSKNLTISNIGKSAIQVSVAKTAQWIDLSETSASLSPGQSQIVEVAINSTAKNLPEGSYKDTVTFTNLTNGKGTTSRQVNLDVGEMQKWLLFLNGYEKNEYKIPGWKTLSGNPIQYGARFDYSFRVEFTIVKKKGKWSYKRGTIILSNVGYGTLYDPTYWAHKPFKCFHCSDIRNLTGTSISGTISGNQARLFWPDIRPRVDTVAQFKLPCKPMPECSKWKSISYYSDEFLDRAGDHLLLLKHNHKKNIPVVDPSKLQWINYNYTLRRLYP